MAKTRGGARPGAGRKPGLTSTGRKNIAKLISMPPQDWEAIDRLAEKLEMTRSAFIRQTMLAGLKNHKNVIDKA